jgi:hypothetical protein
MAMLPTHDPLVGRIVGSMFYVEQMQNKAPVALLEGQINGTDKIALRYEQADDGSVRADGWVGSVEVHETFSPKSGNSANTGSRVFGVAGSASGSQSAQVGGTINGANEQGSVVTARSSEEVELTDALRQSGITQGEWKERIGLAPTFGGEYVEVNSVPARLPTETVPIHTEDHVQVGGQAGGLRWGRDFTWNTTTWNVTNNDRDGWAVSRFHVAESGSENEIFMNDDEKTHTPQPLAYTVSKAGVVDVAGQLVTERPGEPPQILAVMRHYEAIPQKAAFKVCATYGDNAMEFVVYPQPG